MALASAKRHVRVKGDWGSAATYIPTALAGAFSPIAPSMIGDTILAASPSSIDIQTAIDAASDGDTVRVPAGDATWTSDVTVPATKGIQIIGAGVGLTNITFGTYILRLLTKPTNSRVRFSGFTCINVPNWGIRVGGPLGDADALGLGATDWRIDNLQLVGGSADSAKIGIFGWTFGVIDHITSPDAGRCIWVDNGYYPLDRGVPYLGEGGYSWMQPLSAGGPLNVYVEDCNFPTTAVTNIWFNMRCARVVVRHNTFTGNNRMETHSGCTPGFRNPRWMEVYENSYTGPGWMGIWCRSANGMIFNNTVNGGYTLCGRADNETLCFGTCIGIWPTANKTVYPAQDQIGAGMDTGLATAQATDEAKLRIWGNVHNGAAGSFEIGACMGAGTLVQENRDYWQQVTPFTGASGIGVGVLSARPSSGLTVGVGYWATDTNTLYRATGATTWEVLYTPYTYPHPVTLL